MKSFFILILITLIWGFTFVTQKWTLVVASPSWMTAFRFIVASVPSIIFLWWGKSYKREWKDFIPAFVLAFFLCFGLFFQNIGLKYTTIAKCGFITTLYAFFTPLLTVLLLKTKLRKTYWFLLMIAFVGVFLLSEMDWGQFNLGDLYTLGAALCFAFHILYIGKYTDRYPSSMELNCLQCLFTAILASVMAIIYDGAPDLSEILDKEIYYFSFLYQGLCASLLAFFLQIHAQKKVPPHLASLIFLLESPFAAIFGFIILGEMMTVTAIMGASVILFSIALLPRFSQPTNQSMELG